jgi:hypothetical protein
MEELKYPIGKYEPKPFSEEQKNNWIKDLEQLPENLEAALLNLDEAQLNTPYRPEGWTVKQLVHHIADSHINMFCRLKLALSEDNPTIKPYDEAAWALQADVEAVPVNISTTLIHALHKRIVALYKATTNAELDRTYIHPETGKQTNIYYMLGLYAWHSKHHVAHITALRQRNNW